MSLLHAPLPARATSWRPWPFSRATRPLAPQSGLRTATCRARRHVAHTRVVIPRSSAMEETAAYAIIADIEPDRVSLFLGICEISTGVGYMIGPPLGGLLFSLGPPTAASRSAFSRASLPTLTDACSAGTPQPLEPPSRSH